VGLDPFRRLAGICARPGTNVVVYNRTPAKAAKWVETHAGTGGGRAAATPQESRQDQEIVFCCVGQ